MRNEHKGHYKSLCKALTQSEDDRAERDAVWDKHEELYSGRFDAAIIDPVDQIFPNVCQPTINEIVAGVLARPPEVSISARKVKDAARARLLMGLNRSWWENDDTQTQAQEALRDAGIAGIGWLKVSWNYQELRHVEPDPADVEAMLSYRDTVGMALGDLPNDKEIERFLKKQSVQIIDNKPEARRISYKEMWLDSQAKHLREVNWMTHRYHRPTEDVHGDKWYNESVRTQYKTKLTADELNGYDRQPGNHSGIDGSNDRRENSDTAGTELTEIMEMWDMRRRRLYVCAYKDRNNCDALLYEGLWPYKVGHPFVPLTFGPSFVLPDQVYPLSIVEMIGPEQYELTTIAREMMRQRVMHKRKYAGWDDMPEDAVKALQSDIDGDIALFARDQTTDLREVLFPLPTLTVDPQMYAQNAQVLEMINRKTGFTSAQRGVSLGARTSATEASSIDEYAQGRVNLLVHAVQVAMVELARKMIGLAAQYMTMEQVARFVDIDPADLPANPGAFISNGVLVYPFDRNDIAGEYDFSVKVIGAQADTPQVRANRLLQFMQAFGQQPGLINVAAIAAEYAKEIGLPDPGRFIAPPAPPMVPGQGGPGVPSIAGVPGMAPGGGQPPGQMPQQQAANGAVGGLRNAAQTARQPTPALPAGR